MRKVILENFYCFIAAALFLLSQSVFAATGKEIIIENTFQLAYTHPCQRVRYIQTRTVSRRRKTLYVERSKIYGGKFYIR